MWAVAPFHFLAHHLFNMAISIICSFLPMFFISPFAGVWADRYNRKTIIILSDSLIAVSTLALVILFSQGNDAIWLLFVASAIRSVGSSFQTPAGISYAKWCSFICNFH